MGLPVGTVIVRQPRLEVRRAVDQRGAHPVGAADHGVPGLEPVGAEHGWLPDVRVLELGRHRAEDDRPGADLDRGERGSRVPDDAYPSGSQAHRHHPTVRVPGVEIEAGRVVEPGALVDAGGRGAGRVEQPRRCTGDDATADGSDARLLLVAVPVPEAHAVALAVIATEMAPTVGARALRTADPARSAPAAVRAAEVAVEVVAGLWHTVDGAETRAVHLPPARHERAGRAGVDAVELAAEGGVPVAARRAAVAVAAAAVADRRIGGSRTQGIADGRHAERRTDQSRPGQEPAPARVARQGEGQPVDQAQDGSLRVGAATPTGPTRRKEPTAGAAARLAARSSGTTVSRAYTR